MKTPSAQEELAICMQFDSLVHKALYQKKIDWLRACDRLLEHETFLDPYMDELEYGLFTVDEYSVESKHFSVLDYDIEVKNELIAEALMELTKKRQDVILLSYFMEMSDAEIGRQTHIGRSTVNEQRKVSLRMLREYLERRIRL